MESDFLNALYNSTYVNYFEHKSEAIKMVETINSTILSLKMENNLKNKLENNKEQSQTPRQSTKIDTSPKIISLERKKSIKIKNDFMRKYKIPVESLNDIETNITDKKNKNSFKIKNCKLMPDIIISSMKETENGISESEKWSVKDKILFFNKIATESQKPFNSIGRRNNSKRISRMKSIRNTISGDITLPKIKYNQKTETEKRRNSMLSENQCNIDIKLKSTDSSTLKDLPEISNLVKLRIAEFELYSKSKSIKITKF